MQNYQIEQEKMTDELRNLTDLIRTSTEVAQERQQRQEKKTDQILTMLSLPLD